MKTRRILLYFSVAGIAVAFAAGLASAEQWKVVEDGDWCSDRHDGDRYCEVREITIDAGRNVIQVDGGANGGIRVEGWNRDEIQIRVLVKVWGHDDDEAEEIAGRIKVLTDGTIRAEGPKSRHRQGWSVSYRLMVPNKSNLDLETTNGGIGIAEVEGEILADATNGGLHLSGLAGNVKGRTTNGGLDIELDGRGWRGDGLDVQTTNGGISMEIPKSYNAELETGTVNGSVNVDFPIMVKGKISKSIKATLGDGGAHLRARTTNGGVHLTRG